MGDDCDKRMAELVEWRRWATDLLGLDSALRGDEERRAAIGRRVTAAFAQQDAQRYAPVSSSPDLLAAGERDPDVVRKIEENNRRLIASLSERLPVQPPPPALPIGQSFALAGRWRVYFNRHGAVGRPWCVAPDAGGWELAVASIGISAVAETVYQPKTTPDDEDGRPSAWISVDGYLTVHDSGHASIGTP